MRLARKPGLIKNTCRWGVERDRGTESNYHPAVSHNMTSILHHKGCFHRETEREREREREKEREGERHELDIGSKGFLGQVKSNLTFPPASPCFPLLKLIPPTPMPIAISILFSPALLPGLNPSL